MNNVVSIKPRSGLLITFEGIECSGKTTQAMRLLQNLRHIGIQCCAYSDLEMDEDVYNSIMSLLSIIQDQKTSPEFDLLTINLVRRLQVDAFLEPKLEDGYVVILDSFVHHTMCHLAIAEGKVRSVHDATIGINPDLTIYLDLDPKDSARRVKCRETVERSLDNEKIRSNYLKNKGSAGFEILDGTQTPSQIELNVYNIVRKLLTNKGKEISDDLIR